MKLHAFRVRSCAQRVKRVHGDLWKDEGLILRPSRCAHVLKEGAFLKVEGVHSKEGLVSERS